MERKEDILKTKYFKVHNVTDLKDLLYKSAEKFKNRNAFKLKDKNGKIYGVKYIEFKNHVLNVFKYVDNENLNSEKAFRYISNIFINNDNIKDIINLGRKRWQIENQGFYTQKHRTFNISHMCYRH